MKTTFPGFILFLLITSCAGFSDKVVKGNKIALTENDLVKFEGQYELFPDSSFDKNGKSAAIDSNESRSHYHLNYFINSPDSKYEYSKSYKVVVKVSGQNRLKFITQKENLKIDSIEIAGKLQSDGLFYLDNKFLKRNGIPYLAGGYTNHKTRIGLTKDNGLLVNYAYDNSGALLFMFWAGSTYNLGYHYKKFENE